MRLVNPTTGGGGNATVPEDAPIMPPQAFVDNIYKAMTLDGSGIQNMTAKGITHYSGKLAYDVATGNTGFFFWEVAYGSSPTGNTLDLSGNALTQASVDEILAACVAFNTDIGGAQTLGLSEGTNAAPTKDSASIPGNGGNPSVTQGVYKPRGDNNGKQLYTQEGLTPTQNAISWNGSEWELYDTLGALICNSSDDVQFPWQATFAAAGSGTDPIPTITGPVNADVQTLIAAGWDVNTN